MKHRKNARRGAAALLLLGLLASLLSGCKGSGAATPAPSASGLTRYEVTYLDLFDTVTVIKGYAQDEAEFSATVEKLYEGLREYHRLSDVYNDYQGLNNLKTVNDAAGGEPVEVDPKLMELLLFCRDLADTTGGAVDVTLGSVLSLWHQYREAGLADPDHAALPPQAELEEAAKHVGFDRVELDESASTVRLTDPDARLDVGAVAKGYAVERIAETAPTGYLISVGGNICATGPKSDGSSWAVGIQKPDGDASDYLCAVNLDKGSAVTSGDYQRYYTVDGVRYHHIIDPTTLYPATRWRGVSILCDDSGLADGLSTALFVLDREAGEALVKAAGAEALWVDAAGTIYCTEGFEARIRS